MKLIHKKLPKTHLKSKQQYLYLNFIKSSSYPDNIPKHQPINTSKNPVENDQSLDIGMECGSNEVIVTNIAS